MTEKCLSVAQVASARIRNQRAQGTPAAGGVISFNLIALTTQLILGDYLIHLWNARTARILPRFEPKTRQWAKARRRCETGSVLRDLKPTLA